MRRMAHSAPLARSGRCAAAAASGIGFRERRAKSLIQPLSLPPRETLTPRPTLSRNMHGKSGRAAMGGREVGSYFGGFQEGEFEYAHM